MSEFSDRPFMAGSLIGMRAFAVDKFGRLIGPSYAQVFKPGDNVAECRRRQEDSWSVMYHSMASSYDRAMWQLVSAPTPAVAPPASSSRLRGHFGRGGQIRAQYQEASEKIDAAAKRLSEEAVERVEPPKPPEPPPHSLAGVKCTCGFYAYFDGRNEYKDPTRVTALIEGFGVCTVGSAGFRAEKARLVALVRPGKKVALNLIERNYPDVPMYDTKREALANHPLTVDPLPSPDEDDFWTRSAS